jgi:hypothetical protein
MRGDTVQFKIAVVRPHYSSDWVAVIFDGERFQQARGDTRSDAMVNLLKAVGGIEIHDIEQIAMDQHKARLAELEAA